jgi:hypothetical protein
MLANLRQRTARAELAYGQAADRRAEGERADAYDLRNLYNDESLAHARWESLFEAYTQALRIALKG